ncbi:MAG: Na(+)/H(+) antiporter subunit C [Acidimicrobiia bacterium]|nr:Na(+)/H(+) antiporter subunit C [Acidimicrobiia bacterium]
MSLVALVVASVLVAVGVYLVLQRLLTRVIIGLGLVSHGVNLLIVLSAGNAGVPPVLADGVDPLQVSDPLPQAMVLTAIVITFGVTAFLLALALRSYLLIGTDAVEDDIEDRRIARMARQLDEAFSDADMHEETP